MAGARHDSPRPREGDGWHIGSAQLACHPVGLERWKLLCASDLQKAVWLSLCLWHVEIHTHLFSVHGFHLTNAIQLFPTQTYKKRKEKISLMLWLLPCMLLLESAVLQVTCLRFGTIVTFQSLYHIAWVLVSLSKLSVVFFSRQSAGSWNGESSLKSCICLLKIWWDLAHVFSG